MKQVLLLHNKTANMVYFYIFHPSIFFALFFLISDCWFYKND
jgi:hypothetical protein